MFDTITGLPVHPLIIHAVVVLGPLAALLLLLFVLVPRWRSGLRWPTLLLAAIAAGSAWVAEQSGEALEHRIGDPKFDHAEAGEFAVLALFALLAVTVVVVLVLNRPSAKGKALQIVGVVLAVVASGVAGYAVFDAGHTGASSVWKSELQGTSPGGAEREEE